MNSKGTQREREPHSRKNGLTLTLCLLCVSFLMNWACMRVMCEWGKERWEGREMNMHPSRPIHMYSTLFVVLFIVQFVVHACFLTCPLLSFLHCIWRDVKSSSPLPDTEVPALCPWRCITRVLIAFPVAFHSWVVSCREGKVAACNSKVISSLRWTWFRYGYYYFEPKNFFSIVHYILYCWMNVLFVWLFVHTSVVSLYAGMSLLFIYVRNNTGTGGGGDRLDLLTAGR